MTAHESRWGLRISGGPTLVRGGRMAGTLAVIAGLGLLASCSVESGVPSSSASASSGATPAPIDVPGSTLDPQSVTAGAPDGVALAVVVAADAGEETAVLDALSRYAEEHEGTITVHADPAAPDAVAAAIADDADIVVGIGPGVVGAVDLASAGELDQSFLVLGTQLAEPTDNVIAVVWPGAEDRAALADSELTFENATAYADAAVETGVDAFWSGLDGHVIALP